MAMTKIAGKQALQREIVRCEILRFVPAAVSEPDRDDRYVSPR